jgi:nucleoside-diphosphate-sugar epimerase
VKIFIAGATGVVGRRAIPLLIAAGHQITATARTAENRAALERMDANPVDVDLFDRGSVEQGIGDAEAAINLATHIPASTLSMFFPGAWRENDRLRRDASAILADCARTLGVRRFIQESFAPTYPDSGDAWIHEDMTLAPVRYNRSVVSAESSALEFTRRGGIGVVLRFAAFYGPDAGQSNAMIKTVRKGWAPLPGSPDAYISSISHDDAATAVLTALDLPAGIYNVTDDEPLRRREFSTALATALGVRTPKPLPQWASRVAGSLGELMSRSERISNQKLRSAGWKPKYPSVREGWRATLEALRIANHQ